MKQAQLVVVGLCGQSIFLRVPHFHRPEETLHAEDYFAEPGGKGYNQAVAAARLGADVAFAAAVGQDADGDACADFLRQEGVAARFFRKTAHTACAAILTDRAGENRVTVYPGASNQLSGADVESLADLFAGARYALLTPEIPEEAFGAAVRLAGEARLRLIINPAPFQPWVIPYLEKAWCVTPNREEAARMLDQGADEPLGAALARCPCARAVVTLGGQGALWLENGRFAAVPAPSVRPLDTTGAGDALNGALCAKLLEGAPLDEATRFAVRAASFSVTRAHVLASLPTKADLAP